MGVISFRLSTNGIHHAFVSNVPIISMFDNSELKSEYRSNVKDIKAQFAHELDLLKENHKESVNSKSEKFDAQVKAAQTKLEDYASRSKKGMTWANSHVEKYRNKMSALETEKTAMIAQLKDAHSEKVEKWQARQRKALEAEKAALMAEIAKAEAVVGKKHQHKSKNATFWGVLFSYFVGFSVILAFICIVSVEVYRRGAGIEVAYEEEDQKDSILGLFWLGLTKRWDNFFRVRAERFAKVAGASSSNGNRSIGFNHSSAYGTAKNDYNMPTAEYEE